MTTRLIVPPAALAVSMEAARLTARVDVGEDGKSALDPQIELEIEAYTKKAEHKTNRALITQTWRLSLDEFPRAQHGGSAAIKLPKPPLQSVVHVKFYDTAGVQQTLHPEDYFVDSESAPGYVTPAPGTAWPATAARLLAVEVQFVCGYGPDHTFVPADVKKYILANMQQQIAPVANAKSENFDRLLDGETVYL